MLIGFAIASLLVAATLSVPIWTMMTGKSSQAFLDGNIGPEDTNAMRIIQLISAIVGFFLPAILTATILNRRPMKLLGFPGKISRKQVGLVFAIIIAALFVSGFLGWVNDVIPISDELRAKFKAMEDEYNRQVIAIIALNSPLDYLIALVIMAFLPALSEETLFRGGLQNFLTRGAGMHWLSIIIVSLLFSIAHFSYFGFLPRFALGIMLGFLYHYSGRIWLCILAHFLNNALALTVMYIYKLQGKSLQEAMDETSSTWFGVFAVPVLIALLYKFYKTSYVKPAIPEQFTFEQNKGNPPHGI
jgi:membrane protease YdiL (CAAX protease family)